MSCLASQSAKAEYTYTTLSLTDAAGLIEKGKSVAKDLKVNACIAIVDPSGILIAFERMDHAPLGCVEAAIAKARAAALFRIKTSLNQQRVNGDEPAVATLPQMLPLGGGVPVVNNEVVVGAVGVSGAINPVEIRIAEAMVAGYSAIPVK